MKGGFPSYDYCRSSHHETYPCVYVLNMQVGHILIGSLAKVGVVLLPYLEIHALLRLFLVS